MLIYFYRLYCLDKGVEECYVGSTEDIKERMKCHKRGCVGINFKVYKYIRSNGGWSNWSYEILEIVDCENEDIKDDAEAFWILMMDASLNVSIPGQTMKEWIFKNKKNIKHRRRKYYLNNKKKGKERRRKYRLANKEKIQKRIKEYRLANREKIKQQRKKYYLKNKNIC